jgi:hypothetical protein
MSDWIEKAIEESAKRGWLDRAGSAKRLNGLDQVRQRRPKELEAALPPLIIFSMSLDCGGATYRRELSLDHAFVYLSPTLEKETHLSATWAVAHEMAHVVLGHGTERLRTKAEFDADEQAASDLAATWVPKPPDPKNSRFLKLMEYGEKSEKAYPDHIQNSDATAED